MGTLKNLANACAEILTLPTMLMIGFRRNFPETFRCVVFFQVNISQSVRHQSHEVLMTHFVHIVFIQI